MPPSKLSLNILIPMVAREVAVDWKVAVALLQRTINSALKISGVDIRISILCHDLPEIGVFRDRLELVQVDHPIPDSQDRTSKMNDKGLKLRHGVRRAAERAADYVMFLDSDDLISNKLGEIVRDSHSDAVCLERGWLWTGGRVVWLTRNFHRVCGSSYVMRVHEKNFPNWLGGSSRRVCDQSHSARLQSLIQAGAKIHRETKPLCVYTRNTGENWSGRGALQTPKLLYNLPNLRVLTASVREEYSIFPLQTATKAQNSGFNMNA